MSLSMVSVSNAPKGVLQVLLSALVSNIYFPFWAFAISTVVNLLSSTIFSSFFPLVLILVNWNPDSSLSVWVWAVKICCWPATNRRTTACSCWRKAKGQIYGLSLNGWAPPASLLLHLQSFGIAFDCTRRAEVNRRHPRGKVLCYFAEMERRICRNWCNHDKIHLTVLAAFGKL